MLLSDHQFWRWRAIDLLGGKCVRCGWSDKRCIHLEHKHGDGHKRHSRGTTELRREQGCVRGMTSGEIRKLIDSGELWSVIQPLCMNCHGIKTFEEKEYKRRVTKDYKTPLPLFEEGGRRYPAPNGPGLEPMPPA